MHHVLPAMRHNLATDQNLSQPATDWNPQTSVKTILSSLSRLSQVFVVGTQREQHSLWTDLAGVLLQWDPGQAGKLGVETYLERRLSVAWVK